MNVISPETRMMGLPYGEEIMIVGRTMWTQSKSVTDRQTDGDTRTELRSQRASHGKNQPSLAISPPTGRAKKRGRSAFCRISMKIPKIFTRFFAHTKANVYTPGIVTLFHTVA